MKSGGWKSLPNNPRRADGRIHEYCPPEHVAAEMDRLISMHQSHVVRDAPRDVAATWLHHRLTQIHPFQGGNGRVARRLAGLVPTIARPPSGHRPRTPRALCDEPFLIAAGGSVDALAPRFEAWLEEALARGVQEWQSRG